MTPDIINGLFEFAGAFVLSCDVKALYDDKHIKGVYWPTRIFFAAWGLWSLFYYPAIDQMFSFAGGVALVVMNLAWVALAVYYNERFWKGIGV